MKKSIKKSLDREIKIMFGGSLEEGENQSVLRSAGDDSIPEDDNKN